MAEYAKRPEVTVSTMGKVHNPTGEGVQAISSKVKAKTVQQKLSTTAPAESSNEQHATKTKDGTAKRNITRKKTAHATNYDSSHKKHGGHGKGQWNRELLDVEHVLGDTTPTAVVVDEDDPLYDASQDATRFVLTSGGGNLEHHRRGVDPSTDQPVYGPLWTREAFKQHGRTALREYFDAGDAAEVARQLTELQCHEYHADIVKDAMSLAMDKGPREREMTSQLLTQLIPLVGQKSATAEGSGNGKMMEDGFVLLLDGLDELVKDVPEAKTMAASFLARAVVDEVLPPAFLSEQNNLRPGDEVVAKAIALLSREHCTARLERCWGPGDGRPVEELKENMDQLLQEYLLSRELDEAARCVSELNATHFHHELVKRGVKAAMEMGGDDETLDAMAALFGFLVSNAIVSEEQVQKGVKRLHDVLPDLTLDVPAAPKLLATFEQLAIQQGCYRKTPDDVEGDEA